MHADIDNLTRRIFQSIGDYAIFATDLDGNVVACNPGVERLLGYEEAEFVGSDSALVYTAEDRATGVAEHEREVACREGRASDDRWHLRKDGSRVWVNGILGPLHDDAGELIGYVKVMRDQTEQRRVQEALAESEARYRSLLDDVLDTSAVGVFILDADFRVVWTNRAVEECFRLRRDEVLGSDKRELIRTKLVEVIEDSDRFKARVLAAYDDNTYAERFEVLLTPDEAGRRRWLEHRSQPIAQGPLAGGRIEQYYDITERRESEEALARARDELESEVRKRTADLLSLNSELEAFNYSVSHDLRAPLRGLSGFSQVLLDEYEEQLDEKGRHYLKRVGAAAERMGDLIDAMLTLSRVSREKLEFDEVDLSGIAREVADGLRGRDPERSVEFQIEPGIEARGDERLLRVALENLIGNAWKFTRDRERGRIEFGREKVDGELAYFVKDNGAGFDMAFSDKLFVPFQRLHSPADFSGMGIGLATVQRIVHRHRGRVWASGTVGRGAVFYFTLS